MPAMVEVSVASDSAVWALVTWVSADAMLACVGGDLAADEAPSVWSVDSCAWSRARSAWAWARAADREVRSMVASGWPAVTFWPVVTSTAVTRPETPKSRLAWLAGSTVPEDETVWVMVPVETVWTVVVVVIRGVALELAWPSHVPTPGAHADHHDDDDDDRPLPGEPSLASSCHDYLACRLAVSTSGGFAACGRQPPSGRHRDGPPTSKSAEHLRQATVTCEDS